MSLVHLIVLESKEILKKKKRLAMGVCQRDIGANQKKLEQFEQKK